MWVASLGIDHVVFAIDGPIDRRLRAMAELREHIVPTEQQSNDEIATQCT